MFSQRHASNENLQAEAADTQVQLAITTNTLTNATDEIAEPAAQFDASQFISATLTTADPSSFNPEAINDAAISADAEIIAAAYAYNKSFTATQMVAFTICNTELYLPLSIDILKTLFCKLILASYSENSFAYVLNDHNLIFSNLLPRDLLIKITNKQLTRTIMVDILTILFEKISEIIPTNYIETILADYTDLNNICATSVAEVIVFLFQHISEETCQEWQEDLISTVCARHDINGFQAVQQLWQIIPAATREQYFFENHPHNTDDNEDNEIYYDDLPEDKPSAFLRACCSGSADIVAFLIEQVSPAKLADLFKPAESAALDCLLQACTRTDSNGYKVVMTLWQACDPRNREAMFFNPRQEFNNADDLADDLEDPSSMHISAFCHACMTGSPDIVRVLITTTRPKEKELFLKACIHPNNNAMSYAASRTDQYAAEILRLLWDALAPTVRKEIFFNTKISYLADYSDEAELHESMFYLICACQPIQVISFFLNTLPEAEASAILLGKPGAESALHALVRNDNFDTMHETIFSFFKSNAEKIQFITKINERHQNPLHTACSINKLNSISLLLKMLDATNKKNVLMQVDNDKHTPLANAILFNTFYNNKSEMLTLLLDEIPKEFCADILEQRVGDLDLNALHLMFSTGNYELLKRIIEMTAPENRTALIQQPDKLGLNAFHKACGVKHKDFLPYLFTIIPSHEIMPTLCMQEKDTGSTVLHYILFHYIDTTPERQLEIVKIILNAIPTKAERMQLICMEDANGNTPIHVICADNFETAQLLLEELPTEAIRLKMIQKVNKNGENILHALCGAVNLTANVTNLRKNIEYLIKKISAADYYKFVTLIDNQGNTILHKYTTTGAAYKPGYEMLLNLIPAQERSDFIQKSNSMGQTILHQFLSNIYGWRDYNAVITSIEYILSYIPATETTNFINQRDNTGHTALFRLFERIGGGLRHPVVQALCAKGAIIPEEFRYKKRKGQTINDQPQSVHMVEFHQAAALSLVRLTAKFQPNPEIIARSLTLLQKWCSNLSARVDLDQLFAGDGEHYLSAPAVDLFKRERAKIWLEKHLNSRVKEANTNLSLSETIALWWLEIDSLLLAKNNVIEIERMLVSGLHQLQRMYDLQDDTGAEFHSGFRQHNPKQDRSSCFGGTFNQLMDILARINSPIAYSTSLLFGPLTEQVNSKLIMLLEQYFNKYYDELVAHQQQLRMDPTYDQFFSILGAEKTDFIKKQLKHEILHSIKNPHLCRSNEYNNLRYLTDKTQNFSKHLMANIATLLDNNLWDQQLEQKTTELLENIAYLQIPAKLIDSLSVKVARTAALSTGSGKREAIEETRLAMDIEPRIYTATSQTVPRFLGVGAYAGAAAGSRAASSAGVGAWSGAAAGTGAAASAGAAAASDASAAAGSSAAGAGAAAAGSVATAVAAASSSATAAAASSAGAAYGSVKNH